MPEVNVNENDLRAVVREQAEEIANLKAARAALVRTVLEQDAKIASMAPEADAEAAEERPKKKG